MRSHRESRATLLALMLAAGCSHTKPFPSNPSADRPELTGVDLLMDQQARAVLETMGIQREPVHTLLIPMALSRLVVWLGSQNPEIEDLPITLRETERGWQLESPSLDELADWLVQSKRR